MEKKVGGFHYINLFPTHLMPRRAGLWFPSPRQGRYVKSWHSAATGQKKSPVRQKDTLPAGAMPISCIVFLAILQEGGCLLEAGTAILQECLSSFCACIFLSSLLSTNRWPVNIKSYTGFNFQGCYLWFWAQKSCFNYDANDHQQWSCSLEEQSPWSQGTLGPSLSKLDFLHCSEDDATYHSLPSPISLA